MEGAKVSRYVFIALLLILLYLTFRLLQPFLRYIFMGAILTIAIYPLYAWFVNRIKSQKVSSIIVILLILLILVIPSFIIAGVLVKQTIGFISSFNAERLAEANSYVVELLGTQFDMRENFTQLLIGLREFMVKSAVALAGSVAEIVIGLFIMFFIMYYGFVEGNNWVQQLREFIPFTKERKEKLVKEIKNVTTAVIYGQVLIALVQGILGGLGFLIAGISNPVFWGFLMTILAFLPVVGTGLVWAPAGIIEIVNGNILGGVFLMVFCFFMAAGVESVVKPKIISGKGKIHPIVALIGVLGGLKLFGFLGIIIGPLIAALFITMAGFFYDDYVKNK